MTETTGSLGDNSAPAKPLPDAHMRGGLSHPRSALETGRDLVHDPAVSDAQFGALLGAALTALGFPHPDDEERT